MIDFLQTQTDDKTTLDWSVQVKVEAIDPERTVKVVPFLYLSKDASLDATPFGISLDKEEVDDQVSIHGVKVVQKTLHTD